MKKELFIIGVLSMSSPIMASDTLVAVLMSQDTDNVIIDGRTFEGDSITSLVIAPKFTNSQFGGYLSVGGTFGRSEDEKKKDEENKDFKNSMSYRVANLGVTYSPISNVTFLGGVGYAQSEGKYYHNIQYDNRNRVTFDTSHIEKDRGINYNGGINLSYNNFGIIAMYDSYPKVFSVGVSYKYFGNKNKNNPNRYRQQSNKTSYTNSNNKSVQKKKKNCKDGQSDISRGWSNFVGVFNGVLRGTGTINDGKSAKEGYEWGKKAGSEQIIPKLLDVGCK
ncbi:MAG TPA: hypothetical protein ENK66_07910 [Arcobacter sp.]|nr:hypothetical protein [Arcobacter sp.]